MFSPSPARLRRGFVAFAVLISSIGLSSALAPAADSAANQITVFKHTGSQTKSQYFTPTLNQPAGYTKPADFEHGNVYVKIDVLDKPSNRSIIPQLCFWRHTEAQKFKFETCAITRKFAFTEEGTVWIDAKSPVDWFKKNGTWDWSKQASLGRIMLKDVKTGKLLLTSRCGAACYKGNDIDDHVPIQMTAETIFVAKGSTLSPPSGWRNGCPKSWSSQCNGTGGGDPDPTPTPQPTPSPTPGPTPTPNPTPTPGPTPSPEPGANQPDITVVPSDRSLGVSWTKVSGSNLSQFRYSATGKGWKWDQPTDKRSRSVTGLINGQSYQVQVRALLKGEWQPWATSTGVPGGATPPPTPTPDPKPQPDVDISSPPAGNGKDVVLIAGGTGVFGDAPYVGALEDLGYDVTVVKVTKLKPDDLNNKRAAIITSSVKPNDVPGWLADTKVALLVSEAFVMDDLGMSSQAREVGPRTSMTFVTKHAATARTLGEVTTGASGSKYVQSKPPGTATIVAEHSNGDAAIYLYAKGQKMVDGNAPGRRIGWYMSYEAAAAANQNGWNLFGHTVAWLTK